MLSHSLSAAAVLSLLSSSALWAQDPVAAHVGSLVRVTAPSVSHERLVGTLAGANEGFLRLSTAAGPVVIPRSAIENIQWSRAGRRPFLKWTLEGAAVLGAAGFFIGSSANDPNEKEPVCTKRGTCAAVGAGVGAAIGLIASALTEPKPHWEDVPGAKRVSLALRPRPRGVAAALVVGW